MTALYAQHRGGPGAKGGWHGQGGLLGYSGFLKSWRSQPGRQHGDLKKLFKRLLWPIICRELRPQSKVSMQRAPRQPSKEALKAQPDPALPGHSRLPWQTASAYNIAYGCNSMRATEDSLKLADGESIEVGFGADPGAVGGGEAPTSCRASRLGPDAVVLVVTIRPLKYNGGVPMTNQPSHNLKPEKGGIVNWRSTLENLQKLGQKPAGYSPLLRTDNEENMLISRSSAM